MNAVVDMGAFEYGAPSVVGIGGEGSAGAGVVLQVWPNPARARTHVGFVLSKRGRVRVDVFDVAGRKVQTLVDRHLDPGEHEILWDGRDRRGAMTRAGVYFLRLRSVEGEEGRRILRIQ